MNATNIKELILFQNETKLPKLPVPDIEHTLCRYLEALQPILSESHYQRVTSIIASFGADDGIGPKLQEILLKRRELYDNWVSCTNCQTYNSLFNVVGYAL